jgi:hypothetical protein
MGVTSWITKKVLARKMPGVSDEMLESMMQLMTENPELGELFKKIGEEVEVRTKKGEHQMFATMEVMKKHQVQLRAMMQKSPEAFMTLQAMLHGAK